MEDLLKFNIFCVLFLLFGVTTNNGYVRKLAASQREKRASENVYDNPEGNDINRRGRDLQSTMDMEIYRLPKPPSSKDVLNITIKQNSEESIIFKLRTKKINESQSTVLEMEIDFANDTIKLNNGELEEKPSLVITRDEFQLLFMMNENSIDVLLNKSSIETVELNPNELNSIEDFTLNRGAFRVNEFKYNFG